jgi:putative flippase GtrA
MTVKGDRFEYETNMLLAMKAQCIDFEEVKIRTVYIEENKSSHFRTVRDSYRIYKLILAHFFRFTLSSLLSSVVDTGLFVLLSILLQNTFQEPLLTVVPAIGARVVSSLMNFFTNKIMVFRSGADTGTAMWRYFTLAAIQMMVQAGLTYGVNVSLHVGNEQTFLRAVIYVIVMVMLYFASFMIQQHWVFAERKKERN